MRVGDGVAMDLTTVDEQGRPWNFSLEDCRRRATELVEWLDPDLLIGSPPCGPYSQLQALNENKMDPQKRAETLAEAEQHLEFCAEQYAKRHARQKLFLHEHPALAKSWKSEADINHLSVYLMFWGTGRVLPAALWYFLRPVKLLD
jgi:hypothetical protein